MTHRVRVCAAPGCDRRGRQAADDDHIAADARRAMSLTPGEITTSRKANR